MSPHPASQKDDLVAIQATAFTASISGLDGFPAASVKMRSAIPFSA